MYRFIKLRMFITYEGRAEDSINLKQRLSVCKVLHGIEMYDIKMR